MAPTPTNPIPAPAPAPAPPTKTKLVCFSFAAYSKSLIDHLRSLNVPVLPGLTDPEFSLIESTLHFTFPPDLRSILREGLPVGPQFPNWRSSSLQQLQILLNLPLLNLFKNVSKNGFWVDSWVDRPQDTKEALNLAKQVVGDNGDGTYEVPVLVPVLRNCYIPATCPSVSGNPVFHVDDKGVRVISNDLTGFFHGVDRWLGLNNVSNVWGISVPAWAATEPRRVEFWTEIAERGRRDEPRGDRAWWCREEEEFRGLSGCLERVYWTLREGGWGEDEVREIMMMKRPPGPTSDDSDHLFCGDGREIGWHMRVMSLVLLRAGWSMEDVVYSLGEIDYRNNEKYDNLNIDQVYLEGWKWGNKSFLEFQPMDGCDPVTIRRSSFEHLMSPQPVL